MIRSAARTIGMIALVVTALGLIATVALARPSASSDPQQILGRLEPATAADPEKPPPTRPCPDPPCFDPAASRTPAAFLNWVARDVSTFWRRRIEAVPFRWRAGRQAVISTGSTRRSRCSTKPVTANFAFGPFYCASDRPATIFLPMDSIRSMVLRTRTWRNWKKQDFALAYVVAHEWAHHLQQVTRVLTSSRLKSIQIELQADCLAGVWAHSTWARNLLEPGDIDEAIRLARFVGDFPGTPKNDPDAHGSPRQRASWFKRGFDTGDASRCIVSSP